MCAANTLDALLSRLGTRFSIERERLSCTPSGYLMVTHSYPRTRLPLGLLRQAEAVLNSLAVERPFEGNWSCDNCGSHGDVEIQRPNFMHTLCVFCSTELDARFTLDILYLPCSQRVVMFDDGVLDFSVNGPLVIGSRNSLSLHPRVWMRLCGRALLEVSGSINTDIQCPGCDDGIIEPTFYRLVLNDDFDYFCPPDLPLDAETVDP